MPVNSALRRCSAGFVLRSQKGLKARRFVLTGADARVPQSLYQLLPHELRKNCVSMCQRVSTLRPFARVTSHPAQVPLTPSAAQHPAHPVVRSQLGQYQTIHEYRRVQSARL
jgi:hypothetical protein